MDQPPKAVVATLSQKFEPKTLTVEGPSGRKYVLRELTGFEQMQADEGVQDFSSTVYYRVAMSIESVDDERLVPAPKRTFLDLLLKSLPAEDLDALMIAYAQWRQPKAPEVKNEPAPSDS